MSSPTRRPATAWTPSSPTSSPQLRATIRSAVIGNAGSQYSLVVTRGADFTLHGNTFANAQPLNGANVVLGAITKGAGGLFTLDDQLGNFGNSQNPIWATDPITGQFIGNPISAPGSPGNNPFGLNLAFDGTYLYYNDGQYFGDNTIYKIDPTSGAVVALDRRERRAPRCPAWLTSTASCTGRPAKATARTRSTSSTPRPWPMRPRSTPSITDSYLTGLAGDPDLGVLFAVGQTGGTRQPLRDRPRDRQRAPRRPRQQPGLYEQDIAYANGQLIVSDTGGLRARQQLPRLLRSQHVRLHPARAGRHTWATSPAWPATAWAVSAPTGTSST